MRLESWAKRLLISSTFTQATMYVIRPFITYRAIEINAGAVAIGLIGALYALFPVLLALKFGSWVGRFGEGRFLVIGTCALIISSTALIFSKDLFSLAVATAFAGLAHLGLMVGGQTMVALRATKMDYNRLFGYYTFSASLGQMIGPLFAGFVAGSLANGMPAHSSNAFIFAILLSSLALVPTFNWRKSSSSISPSNDQSNTWSAAKSMLARKEISLAIFISLAISTTGDLLVIFLPLLGTEKGIDPAIIGVILSLRALGSMISRFSLGAVSKRIDDRKLLLSTTTIAAISLALMVFSRNPYLLGALVFISGLMLGFGQPLTMAIVSHRTNQGERALAISARLTGNRLGQFLLPIISGLLTSALGAGAAFWCMASLLALGYLAARSN